MPPAVLTPTASAAPATGGDANGPDQEAWKKKNFWQLLNISIGFLGIQFAWAIQMGQMSPLLERLGSNPQLLSWISCAGPVTGVLVQPIVGALSDNCKLSLGRRRPFLLLGAILTAIALVAMPNSGTLVMAAILLWLLDASINITQGPYRAIVPDVVHRSQQATAYSLMSLTIGLGSMIAFLIAFQIQGLHTLFYLGASAILVAMAWTVFTTPEPKTARFTAAASRSAEEQAPQGNFFVETIKSIGSMPAEALKLCLAHSFTWFGLTCLFTFFSVYVPHHVFGAADPNSKAYHDGVQWVSLCYFALNTVCFLFSPLIGKLSTLTSKKATHTLGLLCMGVAFLSMPFIQTPVQVMIAMGLIGVGWATTLSIPFALLSDHLPSGKAGVMMGTFNIFIAAPGVLANLLVGPIVAAYGNNHSVAMVVGGAATLLSIFLLQAVKEPKATAPITLPGDEREKEQASA
jgi:maltose/moltooligosaccharide transporter